MARRRGPARTARAARCPERDPVQPPDGAARLGALVLRDPARQRHVEGRHAGGHWRRGCDLHAGDLAPGPAPARRPRRPGATSWVAPRHTSHRPQRPRRVGGQLRVVQRRTQERHPAPASRSRTRGSPPARRGGSRPPGRSAPRRRSTVARSPASRRAPGVTAPSTSSTLSIISRRPRRRSTRDSSAAVDIGGRRRPSTSSVARTESSSGKAWDANQSQIAASSRPGSSTTSARAVARPARPTCW